VGLLDTLAAYEAHDHVQDDPYGLRMILPDGRVGVAYAAERLTFTPAEHRTPRVWPGPVRAVRLTVAHTRTCAGAVLTMAHPGATAGAVLDTAPWGLDIRGVRLPAVLLTVRAGAPVPVAPPCDTCSAYPGEACTDAPI
jgi:hypothetical protein